MLRTLLHLPPNAPPSTRKEELRSFVFLAIVMVPILSVLTIASYGFAVWIYQMFAGPPGM
ncbi:periplasmic nitrate reductase, NapE protein [Xylophilus sp.]|uniref:periplasmic nitrate reductase, NapE protein n=1 Tax=Xylophilus sp. TaxID=2653893 RepID=UPI0013BCC3DF|nr:periplasmic nitrate reductase, NapE protein [Xylophilus sp.]KAF1050160.1 MAG: hypothetical protein GAK38_00186 [Xylophilus sp.]